MTPVSLEEDSKKSSAASARPRLPFSDLSVSLCCLLLYEVR